VRAAQDGQTRVLTTADGSPSAFGYLARLLRYRAILIGVPIAFLLLGLAFALLGEERYSSESRFVPQSSRQGSSQLMGLAAQFGVNVAGLSGEGESLEFYAELVRSRGILKQAVASTYPTEGGAAATLVDIYEIDAPSEAQRLRAAIEHLDRNVRVHAGIKSGMVTLTTSAEDPQLAVLLNRRLIDLISTFNLEKRQTQASAERRFVEARVQEAEAELRQAEAALTEFYQRNRRIEGSPELQNRAGDLERRVNLRQQIYTSLAQSYEEARISEVRNTPVITVVDAPEDWVKRTSRGAISNGILWAIMGSVIAVAAALLLDRLQRERSENPTEWAELRRTLTLRRQAR
jgi:uncharacterized protein involved in exopolysaccharide biosynthesis